MSLRERTVSGIGWNTASTVLRQVLQTAFFVILARLLTPDAFGLIGMVMVFAGFGQLFSELGMKSALVQQQDLADRHLSSVFYANLGLGFLLTLSVAALAPVFAFLYAEPRLQGIVIGLSGIFALSSLGIVPRAILEREMRFKSLAFIDLTSVILAGAFGVFLAWDGAGAFSLVGQRLAIPLIAAVGVWAVIPWIPTPAFDWGALKELLGFGGNLTGFNAFNYWIRQVDDFLVGRFGGSQALGIYNRAYAVMLLPIRQVTQGIGNVAFPAMSKIQDQEIRLRRNYLKLLGLIALVTFPMMAGLAIVAEEFVLGLLGSDWAGMIPILQILCFVGLMQSIGSTTGLIYKSQGRTDIMFRWGIASGIVTLVAFGIGIQWGVLGVTVAYALRNLALTYFNFSIPGRLIGMSFSSVLKAIRGPSLATLGMVLVLLPISEWTLLPSSNLLRLGALVLLGVVVYSIIVYYGDLQAYKDAKSYLLPVGS